MIEPYRKNPPRRPVALVKRSRLVMLESGRFVPLADVPKGTVIYADRDMVKAAFLLRGDGEAVCWNGTPIRWEVDGRSVLLLGSYPGDHPSTLDGLVAFRDYLADRGAAIGSVSASGFSLLRATLTSPIRCNVGDVPPITEVIGGRQEAFVAPGHYADFESWDLSAAYANTLGQLTYGGAWLEVPAGAPLIVDDEPVIHRARVWTPKRAPYGPLPRRRRRPEPYGLVGRWNAEDREYPRGRMVGVFGADELAGAIEVGSTVYVERTWVHAAGGRQPFRPWLDAIMQARSLPGFGGVLAKRAGNALIGRFFGTPGTRTRAHWSPRNVAHHRPDPLAQQPRWMIPTDAAEVVTSRVRARLLRELMIPAGDGLIAVHTDGGLVLPGSLDDAPLGADWRLKESATGLVFLGPSLYAYRKGSPARTEYKVAGVKPSDQSRVFSMLTRAILNLPTRQARRRVISDAEAWAAFVEAFPDHKLAVPA